MNKETKTNETKYNYRLFTAEDEKMYRDFLESQEYNPGLAEFFHEEYKKEARERNFKRRHTTNEILDDSSVIIEENDIFADIDVEEEKQLCAELLSILSDTQRRVILMLYAEQKTKKEIAKAFGIKRQSLEWHIHSALREMNSYITEHNIENPFIEA